MRRASAGSTILAALAVAGAPSAAPQTAAQRVEIVGTVFHVTLADGHVLAQAELPGVVLAIGDGSGNQRRIRIDAVEPDPKDKTGEILLYQLSEQDSGDGSWKNLCLPDPDGKRLGFPLAGAFTADGRYVAAPGKLLITCTGGAEGKCVRFGYKPWRSDLAPYYQACVRLVRADYCGDGVGHTRNGTPIDIFDRIGVQEDEPAAALSFEAAWGPEGAVCVRHTRLKSALPTEGLADICPRLAGRIGQNCDEATPALLYDRSAGN